MLKQCNSKSNPNLQSRLLRKIGMVLSNGALLSNKFGSVKERTQMMTITYCMGVPEVATNKLGN